jgi:hypothetical protein
MPGDATQKSWFAKPEGKVGTILPIMAGVAGAGLLVYFWGTILPWVILMLENTITAVALAGVLALMAVVVFDPRWRNLLIYLYKAMMRGITSAFIEIDPIGILKTYVSNLRKKLEEMDNSIANLAGQLRKLKEQIDKNEANRIHSLQLAQQAQKRGEEMRNVFVLQSRQAGRLGKSNMTLQNLYDRMATLAKVLGKYRAASSLLVDDIQGEVEVKTAERAALLAGYNAFSQARKIMQGGDDEREMFDMTLEKLADDYGMKMGEIETFMDMSKSIIDGVDLDNGIYEADALAQLEKWETKSNSLLVTNADAGAIGAGAGGVRVDVAPSPGVRVDATPISKDGFADLFEEKADDQAAKKAQR